MSKKERYIVLNDMQIEDTQNRSQDWLNIKVICRRLNKQDQQIDDLEAKLAESKKAIVNLTNVCDEWADKYIKLQKQLAEKEHTITNLIEDSVASKELLKQQLAEKDGELHQIYSHLGVEAFGEDIHEQALKEIAEKDQAIEGLQEINKSLGQTCNNDAKEIERLGEELEELKTENMSIFEYSQKIEEQLAEKDKEVEELKTDLFVKNLDKEYDCILGLQNAEQDKISFAVEKLEKVKDYLTQELENVTELLDPLEYEDYHEFIGCGRGYKNSIEEIDNQIKQLKEGK